MALELGKDHLSAYVKVYPHVFLNLADDPLSVQIVSVSYELVLQV